MTFAFAYQAAIRDRVLETYRLEVIGVSYDARCIALG